MKDVASDSSVIFYGEIIGVQKIGRVVAHGEKQEYEITIFPQKVYKGNAKERYKFEGYAIYNDTDANTLALGGCSQDKDLGAKFVVMIEKGKNIDWNWCEKHVIPSETKQYEYFVKNIQVNL